MLAAAPPGDDENVELIKAASAGALAEAWAELEERAERELGESGEQGEISLRHYAYVRYGGQLFDHEVLAPKARPESVADLDEVCDAFEQVYETLYPAASKHSEAGYQILEVALAAAAHTRKPTLPRYEAGGKKPPAEALKGERPAYFKGEWLPFRIYEMDRLGAGNEIDGPCIVEHPATTLLVPHHGPRPHAVGVHQVPHPKRLRGRSGRRRG